MKKKIIIIVVSFIVAVSMVLLTLFCVIPNVYKKTYEKNKTPENLYKMCKYIYTFNSDELVLEYYPTLLFETDYNSYSWENEKDNMITRVLNISLNNSKFDVFKELLSKGCAEYSTAEFAEICCVDFIYGYYERYQDLEGTYILFETVAETFDDVLYKQSIYGEYAEFVNLYSDDTEKFEEVNSVQKELADKAAEQIKVQWEQ